MNDIPIIQPVYTMKRSLLNDFVHVVFGLGMGLFLVAIALLLWGPR